MIQRIHQTYDIIKLNKKTRIKFSQEEDEKLTILVSEYGECNWGLISEKMKKRSSRQCRDRWVHYLSHKEESKEWSAEEDDLLLMYYRELGCKWKLISEILTGKTPVSVRNRCCKLLRRNNRMNKEKFFYKIKNNFEQNNKLLNGEKEKKIILPSCYSIPFPYNESFEKFSQSILI